jgi:hypothetical protein
MIPAQNSPLFRFTLHYDLLGTLQLRHDPIGWDTLGISLTRSRKAHGMGIEYTTQLGFVKEGKAYLQRAFDAAGIEADITLTIEQYNPNEFSWALYYTGRISFIGAAFTATQIKVNVENTGFIQQFLSRDSVVVDLFGGESVSGTTGPLPTPVDLPLHSRELFQRYEAKQTAEVETQAQMFGDEDDPSHEQVLYFGFDTPVTNELGLGAVAGGFVPGDAQTVVPIYTATSNGRFTFELALNVHIEAHNTADPTFEKVDGVCHFRINGSPDTAIQLMPDVSEKVDGDYIGDIFVMPRTIVADLNVGDNVYLYADYWVHEVGGGLTTYRYRATISALTKPGSYFKITAQTVTEPTLAKGVLVYDAFNRVAQALTDELDVFRSDFFGRTDSLPAYPTDGPGSLAFVTSGFQVRGFPLLTDPAPVAPAPDLRKTLTTTWSDLFSSLAAVHCLGSGFEWALGRQGEPVQVIRVEPASYFYSDEVVLDLTDVGPLVVTTRVSLDDYYQVIELGYQQWQAEQINGLGEFNSTRQWTTPLTQVKATYSQQSKFATAGMLIETTRRQRYDATASTDDSRDTTNFLISLVRDGAGYTTERDQRLLTSTGLFSPQTAYNLAYSPGRMLRNHGAILRAGLQPTGLVRFTSGTGNTTMTSQLAGEPAVIAEGGDVAVTNLGAPRWQALIHEFTAPVNRVQHQFLIARPKGRVRFLSDSRKTQEGWILDYKHTAGSQLADFTLLACAP